MFFLCTVTDFSAAEDRGVKFCMRVGLLSRSSPFSVKIGSRGVTGAALLLGCMWPSGLHEHSNTECTGGDSELGAVARWDSRKGGGVA